MQINTQVTSLQVLLSLTWLDFLYYYGLVFFFRFISNIVVTPFLLTYT